MAAQPPDACRLRGRESVRRHASRLHGSGYKATRVGLQGYTGATRVHRSGYKASVVTATRVHGSTYMGTTGPLTRVARARRHPGYSFQCPNATHISLWNLPASQEEGV